MSSNKNSNNNKEFPIRPSFASPDRIREDFIQNCRPFCTLSAQSTSQESLSPRQVAARLGGTRHIRTFDQEDESQYQRNGGGFFYQGGKKDKLPESLTSGRWLRTDLIDDNRNNQNNNNQNNQVKSNKSKNPPSSSGKSSNNNNVNDKEKDSREERLKRQRDLLSSINSMNSNNKTNNDSRGVVDRQHHNYDNNPRQGEEEEKAERHNQQQQQASRRDEIDNSYRPLNNNFPGGRGGREHLQKQEEDRDMYGRPRNQNQNQYSSGHRSNRTPPPSDHHHQHQQQHQHRQDFSSQLKQRQNFESPISSTTATTASSSTAAAAAALLKLTTTLVPKDPSSHNQQQLQQDQEQPPPQSVPNNNNNNDPLDNWTPPDLRSRQKRQEPASPKIVGFGSGRAQKQLSFKEQFQLHQQQKYSGENHHNTGVGGAAGGARHLPKMMMKPGAHHVSFNQMEKDRQQQQEREQLQRQKQQQNQNQKSTAASKATTAENHQKHKVIEDPQIRFFAASHPKPNMFAFVMDTCAMHNLNPSILTRLLQTNIVIIPHIVVSELENHHKRRQGGVGGGGGVSASSSGSGGLSKLGSSALQYREWLHKNLDHENLQLQSQKQTVSYITVNTEDDRILSCAVYFDTHLNQVKDGDESAKLDEDHHRRLVFVSDDKFLKVKAHAEHVPVVTSLELLTLDMNKKFADHKAKKQEE